MDVLVTGYCDTDLCHNILCTVSKPIAKMAKIQSSLNLLYNVL